MELTIHGSMSSVHVYDEVALGTMTMHASDEDADLLKAVIARAELTIYGSMTSAHAADEATRRVQDHACLG